MASLTINKTSQTQKGWQYWQDYFLLRNSLLWITTVAFQKGTAAHKPFTFARIINLVLLIHLSPFVSPPHISIPVSPDHQTPITPDRPVPISHHRFVPISPHCVSVPPHVAQPPHDLQGHDRILHLPTPFHLLNFLILFTTPSLLINPISICMSSSNASPLPDFPPILVTL